MTKGGIPILEALKEKVCRANLDLVRYGVVIFTWGNVSAMDRESGYVVIKPSGVPYEEMRPERMVVTDMDGNIIEGDLKPSTDLPTHLEIYKAFHEAGGVAHTHSKHATAWAQAGRDIPCYGTTHADYFYGDIPCTRSLTREEVGSGYEKNTGLVIAETLEGKDPMAMPGCLVKNHGVFSWGKDADTAVHNAVVMEYVAEMAAETEKLAENAERAPQYLSDKHYMRKHGINAYYGQETEK